MFLVENSRRLGFLLGDSGTGKSLLMALATDQLRQSGCQVVRLNLTGLDRLEFTWKLATGLGHLSTPAAGPVEWWRGIADRLAVNRYERRSTVVLLDDVGDCSHEVGATVGRLALTDQQPDARLTIVLACRRRQVEQLGSKLNDLCELRIEVDPWEAQDTAGYVRDTLVRLGGRDSIFQPQALARLHELAGGNPRRVRQLAEVALVAGAAGDLQQIDPQLVETVHRDLATEKVTEAA
jgi:type II secretory pathway predicted ATPase ExeA